MAAQIFCEWNDALELAEIADVLVRLESRYPLHRKRESQHRVNGCRTLRNRLHDGGVQGRRTVRLDVLKKLGE